MKILVVGSDQVFAIENSYVKYLRASGVEVLHFPAQRIFIDYYKKSLANRILFKTGLSAIYKTINNEFQRLVNEFHPEIIWIFKGMELFPETLGKVSANAKLVNFNADNPFVFSGTGSGNKNISDSLGLYDLHFTYNPSVKRRLESEFNIKTVWLPFGFDVDEQLFQQCSDQPELMGVCFLANADQPRADFIRQLADYGIQIDLYGKDWQRFVHHPLVNFCGSVFGEELWKTLRRYRVQLNLMRPHNEDSHNMRTFEVPGIGGIMVAPATPDHRVLFDDGNEVFLFTSAEDCAGKVKELLEMSADQSAAIRIAARNRSVASGYSYQCRAEQALKEFIQLTA